MQMDTNGEVKGGDKVLIRFLINLLDFAPHLIKSTFFHISMR